MLFVYSSAVFSGQPIAQSHTVAHHLVSKTFSPRAERAPQPFSRRLVFATVQSGGESMAAVTRWRQ